MLASASAARIGTPDCAAAVARLSGRRSSFEGPSAAAGPPPPPPAPPPPSASPSVGVRRGGACSTAGGGPPPLRRSDAAHAPPPPLAPIRSAPSPFSSIVSSRVGTYTGRPASGDGAGRPEATPARRPSADVPMLEPHPPPLPPPPPPLSLRPRPRLPRACWCK
eukprot:169779-Chlamydomonas_euryale.AAC.1